MKTKSLAISVLVVGAMLLYALPAVAEIPAWGFILDSASIDVTCDGFTVNVAGYSCEGEGCGVPAPQSKRTIKVHDLWVTPIDPAGDPIYVEIVEDFDVALGDFDESRTYNWADLLGDTLPCGSYHIAVEVDMPCRYYNLLEEDIECPCGCTLTLGYWKTHAGKGPQEMDPTWLSVGGPDAPLFESGQTWYEAFQTSSAGGNAWYILAHQWMAAKLNTNQASAPQEVLDALVNGEDLLEAYDERLIPKKDESGEKNPDRALAIALAETLDDYNKGDIGPGHCDDSDLEFTMDALRSGEEFSPTAGGCSSVNTVTVPNAKDINLQLLVLGFGAVLLGKRVVRKK